MTPNQRLIWAAVFAVEYIEACKLIPEHRAARRAAAEACRALNSAQLVEPTMEDERVRALLKEMAGDG